MVCLLRYFADCYDPIPLRCVTDTSATEPRLHRLGSGALLLNLGLNGHVGVDLLVGVLVVEVLHDLRQDADGEEEYSGRRKTGNVTRSVGLWPEENSVYRGACKVSGEATKRRDGSQSGRHATHCYQGS